MFIRFLRFEIRWCGYAPCADLYDWSYSLGKLHLLAWNPCMVIVDEERPFEIGWC
jgi:hypothetical protein